MSICRNTVAASLRRQGLRAKAARKFKATTHSKHSLPVAPNLLDQDFDAKGPIQKMGERHHIPGHRPRLVILGRRYRFVCSTNYWLGDEQSDESRSRL